MKTNKLNKFSLVIFLVFISIYSFGFKNLIYLATGYFYGYDFILEYKINNLIEENNHIINLKLQDFTDKEITKICSQSPYILQPDFEQRIEQKVNNFTEVDDTWGFILWIFFVDGSNSRIRTGIHRKDNTSICTQEINVINIEKTGTISYFFFPRITK